MVTDFHVSSSNGKPPSTTKFGRKRETRSFSVISGLVVRTKCNNFLILVRLTRRYCSSFAKLSDLSRSKTGRCMASVDRHY